MKIYLLQIIIFLAFLPRFRFHGTNFPSLTWDEAAWRYNAYLLGIDDRDEFGGSLPVTYLEPFGDIKPSLYAYFTILRVKLLSLNEFFTRFESAFFGVLTVFLTFFYKGDFYKIRGQWLFAFKARIQNINGN